MGDGVAYRVGLGLYLAGAQAWRTSSMTGFSKKNSRSGRCGAAIGGAALLALVDVSQAQPQTLLMWDAPAGCPQRDDVLAVVREITGEQVFASTSLHATGRITKVEGKYRLHLEIEGESGTYARTLDARNCDDLLNASAVVLGLNLKAMAGADDDIADSTSPSSQDASGAQGEKQTPQGENADAVPSTSTTAPKRAPSKRVTDAPRPRVSPSGPPTWWLGLPHLHVAVGALPSASFWWGGSIGKRWGPWATWLAGRYHLPQPVRSDEASDVGARVARYGGEFGLAHAWRMHDFELAPAALVELEHLTVQGTGGDIVTAKASSNVIFVGANVTGRWWATDWLTVALAGGVDVPTSRPKFVVEELGEQAQFGGVVGRLSLGVEWNF
jgi:hypothetical protein